MIILFQEVVRRFYKADFQAKMNTIPYIYLMKTGQGINLTIINDFVRDFMA